MVFKNQLFIVGETTTEAFSNIGGADFPFQRSGLFWMRGPLPRFQSSTGPRPLHLSAAARAKPRRLRAKREHPQKISTDAIDELLRGLTTAELAAVYGWSYAQSGHFFIGWTLPTTAIVFDTTTGIWAERASRYIDENDDTIDITYRAACFVQAYGNLYGGYPGRANRPAVHGHLHGVWGGGSSGHVHPAISKTTCSRISCLPQTTMESGVGNASEPDPMIIMDRSLNGGKSFTYVRERPIGKGNTTAGRSGAGWDGYRGSTCTVSPCPNP